MHGITQRRVLQHVAVAVPPLHRMFRIEPQHALGAALDRIDQIEAWIVVVVAPVAEEDHRGAAINAVEVIVRKFDERCAEIGV